MSTEDVVEKTIQNYAKNAVIKRSVPFMTGAIDINHDLRHCSPHSPWQQEASHQ
jgi:hypothetical protein